MNWLDPEEVRCKLEAIERAKDQGVVYESPLGPWAAVEFVKAWSKRLDEISAQVQMKYNMGLAASHVQVGDWVWQERDAARQITEMHDIMLLIAQRLEGGDES